jgi:hypothetical protein
MNSIALAEVKAAIGLYYIHFVNLSIDTIICVYPPWAFLNGSIISSPQMQRAT